MRAGGAGGDPEGDGRRTLVNGSESRLWRLGDKQLREGRSIRQFGRPSPLRIRHRRRREKSFSPTAPTPRGCAQLPLGC